LELFIGLGLLSFKTRQIKLQTIPTLKDFFFLSFCYLPFHVCYNKTLITKNTSKIHRVSEQEAKALVRGGSATLVNGACKGREIHI
jgi:hypothetical protein